MTTYNRKKLKNFKISTSLAGAKLFHEAMEKNIMFGVDPFEVTPLEIKTITKRKLRWEKD
jgi:hypothetical protein